MTNRDRPDIAALRTIDDPERFVWSVLPHAARSFAISILVLPEREAWPAAVAYLQCRILDTYEDLHPDVGARPGILRAVGRRWQTGAGASPPPLPVDLVAGPRDELHALLIERIDLVDGAYDTLSDAEQESIDELVSNMGEGMAWAAETFAAQNGALIDRSQRARYCHYVIGEPALYAMRSLLHTTQSETGRRDALDVSIFIQLANVTRDIEKDLQRGVAYDERLRPLLGAVSGSAAEAATIAQTRRELMREALECFPAYARLVAGLPSGISQTRGAAVLMLGFTDRYYAGCAVRAGDRGWRRRSRLLLYADGILGSLSHRWADRTIERSRANFEAFLARTG